MFTFGLEKNGAPDLGSPVCRHFRILPPRTARRRVARAARQVLEARADLELEALRLTLRDKLDRQDRETLLKLTDLAIELREVVSLASFTAGFQLALGIAGELTPYSFEDDEEERALRRQEQKEP